MGRFSKYLGKVEVDVNGEKLQLDLRLKDVEKMLSVAMRKEYTEETTSRMVGTFVEILSRSYPNEPVEEQTQFIVKNSLPFMMELFISLGWAKRDQLQKQVESLMPKKEEEQRTNS